MRRRAGVLIPIEHDILQALTVLERSGTESAHGFLIAKRMSTDRRSHRLASHGTLYRALERLERWGFLASEWEDPQAAADAGRPRRRFYRLSGTGRAVAAAGRPKAKAQLQPRRVRV